MSSHGVILFYFDGMNANMWTAHFTFRNNGPIAATNVKLQHLGIIAPSGGNIKDTCSSLPRNTLNVNQSCEISGLQSMTASQVSVILTSDEGNHVESTTLVDHYTDTNLPTTVRTAPIKTQPLVNITTLNPKMPTWGDNYFAGTVAGSFPNTNSFSANVYSVNSAKTYMGGASLKSSNMSARDGYSLVETKLKNNNTSIVINFYGFVSKFNGCGYRIYQMGSHDFRSCNNASIIRNFGYHLWLDSSEFEKSGMKSNNAYTGEIDFEFHINNKLIIPIKIPIRVNVPTTP